MMMGIERIIVINSRCRYDDMLNLVECVIVSMVCRAKNSFKLTAKNEKCTYTLNMAWHSEKKREAGRQTRIPLNNGYEQR